MDDGILKKYWEVVATLEDYLISGYKRSRETVELKASAFSNVFAGESDTLEELVREVLGCTKCRLHETRNIVVPGEGSSNPLVMIIGEGPGGEEDRSGRPFVGRAGQYLDKWLDAIGLTRGEHCFIANIVKCRPPNNRDPMEDECNSCLPYLYRQIDLLQPKAILTVGRISSQILTGLPKSLGSLRGAVYEFKGIPLVTTYHPSGVLRNPEYRRPVWEDLKLLQSLIENA
jgi:DNA polymerase